MNITPFFLELRSAYQSEIDDLTFDSEGGNVLRDAESGDVKIGSVAASSEPAGRKTIPYFFNVTRC